MKRRTKVNRVHDGFPNEEWQSPLFFKVVATAILFN